jgi:ABC-type sugar transport system substrate-binding protein
MSRQTWLSRRGSGALIGVAVALSAAFVAAQAGVAASGNTTSATKTIKTLHFVNPLPSVPIWQQISSCLRNEAKLKGIKYSQTGPPASKPADPTVMIQEIQQAVATKKDAIVTIPMTAAFGPVLRKAQKAGVVTATLYGDAKPASGGTVNAGVDWNAIGQKYVAAIAAIPGQHVVGLVTAAPTGVGKFWADGFTAAAAKTNNVKVSATVYIGADASQALTQVTSLLTAHPDIDIVASNTGLMTQGGVAAIKAKGLEGKVHLLVINNANGGPEAVKDGYAIGVYLQDLCDLSKRTVDAMINASRGKYGKRIPTVLVHDVVATKENVDLYIKKGWN